MFSEGVKFAVLLALGFAASAAAEEFELGGTIGYGVYRNGSVIAPGGTADAGIRNRFVAGAVIGEELYDYISGEFRYLYHDGDPFVSAGGKQGNIQGQSHTFTYNGLFHLRPREQRLRPFFAAGIGGKWFHVTGPPPQTQPFPGIAALTRTDQSTVVVALGGGVKYDLSRRLRLRFDFLDYISPFPSDIIVPANGATARGILHQFTPSFGISLRL